MNGCFCRINDDELRMFYDAANGDMSSCLSSLKKTIHWRETYRILTEEELQQWSDMLFWHGFDVNHRPCLIVRLGLACFSLPYCERPRFAQAVSMFPFCLSNIKISPLNFFIAACVYNIGNIIIKDDVCLKLLQYLRWSTELFTW